MTENPESTGLPESWQVHLPIFEGPLDLLLHLIRINQVEITDIPVALICDQFQEYLSLMEELDLDIAAEYIYEAAMLVYLKSKMLLPQHETESGEEAEDPRQQLVERLLEYQKLKDAAQTLAEIHSVRSGVWTRDAKLPTLAVEEGEVLDLGDVSLFDLLRALRGAMERYEYHHPDALQLQRETFAIRDQFKRILVGLEGGKPLDLLDDLRLRSCRAEIVSAFLAVLELARLNLVRLHQTRKGDVLLYRTTREVTEEEMEGIQV